MNKEIKEKWLNALRSGEYKQGRNQLKTEDRFCCLGVLCDLYIKETKKAKWENKYFVSNSNGATESSTLPLEVMEWANINDKDPIVTVNNKSGFDFLSGLNDSRMLFNEIADLIEKYL